jgi:hypothetical protein
MLLKFYELEAYKTKDMNSYQLTNYMYNNNLMKECNLLFEKYTGINTNRHMYIYQNVNNVNINPYFRRRMFIMDEMQFYEKFFNKIEYYKKVASNLLNEINIKQFNLVICDAFLNETLFKNNKCSVNELLFQKLTGINKDILDKYYCQTNFNNQSIIILNTTIKFKKSNIIKGLDQILNLIDKIGLSKQSSLSLSSSSFGKDTSPEIRKSEEYCLIDPSLCTRKNPDHRKKYHYH